MNEKFPQWMNSDKEVLENNQNQQQSFHITKQNILVSGGVLDVDSDW